MSHTYGFLGISWSSHQTQQVSWPECIYLSSSVLENGAPMQHRYTSGGFGAWRGSEHTSNRRSTRHKATQRSLFVLFALLCFTRPPRVHVLILLVISKRLGFDLRMNQSEDLDTEHDDGLWFACTVLRRTPPLSL